MGQNASDYVIGPLLNHSTTEPPMTIFGVNEHDTSNNTFANCTTYSIIILNFFNLFLTYYVNLLRAGHVPTVIYGMGPFKPPLFN